MTNSFLKSIITPVVIASALSIFGVLIAVYLGIAWN
jgi:hypothetical protein